MFDMMPWRRQSSRELMGFKNEIDNLFNRFFNFDFPSTREFIKESQWAPRVNVSDSARQITVQAEMPGCKAADIDVSLNGRMLTLKGEKKQDKEEKEKNYIRVERAHGLFTRTIELPTEVDAETIEASYKEGVLKVVLNKTATSETKKIEIKSQ